jgi:hypothetical protein
MSAQIGQYAGQVAGGEIVALAVKTLRSSHDLAKAKTVGSRRAVTDKLRPRTFWPNLTTSSLIPCSSSASAALYPV